jgi:hypothetical protein
MNRTDGLAAMPLVLGERTGHPAIERFDRGVEDGASGVKMMGAKCVGIARQTGAGKVKAVGRDELTQVVWHLVSLERLVIAVGARRPIISASLARQPRIGP